MVLRRTLISILFAAAIIEGQSPPAAQQKQQPPAQPKTQRDLVIENERPPVPPAAKTASTEPVSTTIPRGYALVVGISHYKNLPPNLQLHFPERDAESIFSTLISPEGGNFRAENVHKLVGPRATLANLRHELEEWLPSVTKDDDRVFIYFAGHGVLYDGNAYLAPYDFDMPKADVTGYPMDTLGKVVGSKIKGKWKVLLTDSCHSGAITPETKPEVLNQKLQTLNPSIFSLTASRGREQSFESEAYDGGHGVFTYYVVKGMQGEADANGDGIVNADELAEYVRTNVRDQTKGGQNPTSDRGDFDNNMLLAYNPSGTKPGAPPPPQFGELVFESNMDGVELFVDDDPARPMKKGEPLRLAGMRPGMHKIKAVKMGYEPDGPREEMVYPGQQSTVKIKIMILRRRGKAATDLFDKGVEFYTKGGQENYRKAEDLFRKALAIDPRYSSAEMYLGRTLRSLDQQDKAEAAYRRAIEIDPDYTEARCSFAGMLLDTGNVDESIRQLNVVTQREPDNSQALYLLAQAYRMKEAYAQSIDAAQNAIRLTPNNPDVHFWLAESLRMNKQWAGSEKEYQQYLRLSNFDSKLAGQLNYYVAGYLIGFGKKHRATRRDIWADLRSLAYFGLCDCEKQLKHYDTGDRVLPPIAVVRCQGSLYPLPAWADLCEASIKPIQ